MRTIQWRAAILAALATALMLSSISSGTAQVRNGAVEIGLESGPFLIIASGGHETVGGVGVFFEPHVGYFVTDALVVGATGFFYNTFDSDVSGLSLSYGGAFAYVNYHFSPGSTWSPYIGGRIGAFDPNDEMIIAFGFQTGLQFFVARQLSINGQLALEVAPGSGGVAFFSSLGLGLSVHL